MGSNISIFTVHKTICCGLGPMNCLIKIKESNDHRPQKLTFNKNDSPLIHITKKNKYITNAKMELQRLTKETEIHTEELEGRKMKNPSHGFIIQCPSHHPNVLIKRSRSLEMDEFDRSSGSFARASTSSLGTMHFSSMYSFSWILGDAST